MRKPITSDLIYTGGNIYIGTGSTNEGNWYIADHSNDAVRILTAPHNLKNGGFL